ncbi:JAB domain-containing protein [Parabacteroides sp. PF5-9]|uniref:JAB domain-containing protein n=1 Tax=Parabacteroides sp. PF5-9 TaxID=1742404 RepID=UPI002476EC1A|nr:JAB domain-containing protein [Parabacteroides sp. PF5-9]MDH6358963.1 DNA repair protein RadC [Parabacteroides sp. PF5-9]
MYNLQQIKLVYSLSKTILERPTLSHSKNVYDFLIEHAFDSETIGLKESFKAVFVSINNKVLGIYPLAEGGCSHCPIDTKLIMSAAILSNAQGIILAHNHPSGNITPSSLDKAITEKIKQASNLLDIRLLDHIIVTPFDYYSFSDNGII